LERDLYEEKLLPLLSRWAFSFRPETQERPKS